MLPRPSCITCVHYRGVALRARKVVVCDAYPDGIPSVIATGVHTHLEPYEGDHGIQYEPEENTPVELLPKGWKRPAGG